jgi:LytS/YehU family sensor histidine kinase
MRWLFRFVVFSTLHFMLSVASLFLGMGVIMAAFDGDGSARAASVAVLVMRILYFPFVNGLPDLFPGLRALGRDGWAVFALNSIIWGALAALIWSWWQQRRQRALGTVSRVAAPQRRGAV